jgi:nucleotidyltransferase/DNA polymerase involved in DNA repair
MLAKIASNMNKPNGQFYIPNDRKAVDEFIKGTRLAKINGIGKVTAKILEGTLGATTAGQLWEQRHWARLLFTEIQADFLLRCSMGLGSSGHGEHEYERQSISVERTFPSLSSLDRMVAVLKDLCEELTKQMEMEGLAGKNVGIKMKASDFTTTTRAITLKRHVLSAEEMFSHAKQLLVKHHPPDLRLLGVRMSMLELMDEVMPEETIDTFIVKMESESSSIKCPICLKPIAVNESESERLVNEHVDLCLAKSLANEDEEPKRKQFKVDTEPKPRAPTLDAFFKRR